jgi:hypothetical protein
VTAILQWLSLAIVLLIFASFAFLYIRHGTKVQPDPDRKAGDGLSGIGSDSGPSHD